MQGGEDFGDVLTSDDLVESTADFLSAAVDEDAGVVLRLGVFSQLVDCGEGVGVFVKYFFSESWSLASERTGM